MTTINLPLPAAAPAVPAASTSGSPGAPAGAGAPALPGAPAEAGGEETVPQEFAELLAALVAPLVAQVTSQPAVDPTVPVAQAAVPQGDVVVAEALAVLAAVAPVVAPSAEPAVADAAEVPVAAPVAAATAAPVVADVAPEAVGADDATAASPATDEVVPDEVVVAGGVVDAAAPAVGAEPAVSPMSAARARAQQPAAEAVVAAPVQREAFATDAATTTEEEQAVVTVERVEPAPAAPQPAVTTATAGRVQDVAPTSQVEVPSPVRQTPPFEQVAVAVTPLLQREDGSYHVSLRLHPEELGAVHVEVELRNGEVHLSMRADNEAGRETLRASLSSLRSELEAAGVRAGALDVGDGLAGRTPDRQDQGRRDDRSSFTPGIDAVVAPAPETVTSGADGAVDVRM